VIEQKYDILIIATGSRSASPGPWKTSLKGYDDTVKGLHEMQEAVGKAKTIVVGGGGATGVETAGELKFEYGDKKEITLVSARDNSSGAFTKSSCRLQEVID
jgi:NADH dehydrogenase FAD-containing subunit